MARKSNPFGDDITDLVLIGAIGVGAYFLWQWYQNKQLGPGAGVANIPASAIADSTSNIADPLGAGSTFSSITDPIASLFPATTSAF